MFSFTVLLDDDITDVGFECTLVLVVNYSSLEDMWTVGPS